MSYPPQPFYAPQPPPAPKSNKVRNIVLSIILLAFVGSFIAVGAYVLSGPHSGYNGTAIIMDKDTHRKKCYLHIKREDGVEIERQAAGYRNECGKYDKGDTVDIKNGIVYDRG